MRWEPKEIVDFDNTRLADESYMSTLRAQLEEHQVLILRDQHDLTLDQNIALAAHFGAVESSLSIDTAHSGSSRVQLMARDSRVRSGVIERVSSSFYWHTDRSFLVHPPAVTTLHAQALPPSGGDTLFANLVSAYDAARQLSLAPVGLSAVHSYAAYLRDLQPNFYSIDDVAEAERRFPDVVHSLIRTSANSAHCALNLSELCITNVEGMTDKDSRELLDSLYRLALDPGNVYCHSWREADLLIWSNFGVMHRGTECEGQRVMFRTVAGQLRN